MSFIFGKDDKDKKILNTIKNNYFGHIRFAIQRVFQSPTGNEIITHLSPPISLPAIQGTNIPLSIKIVDVNDDKKVNKLESFFEPVATIVYFYKYQIVNTKYGYKNNMPIIADSSLLKFRNGGNSMFNSKIMYNGKALSL